VELREAAEFLDW